MTQTAVNFTVDLWNSSGVITNQTYDTRVFDFEISDQEKNYYDNAIQKLISIYDSGNLSDPTTLETFRDNLYALNAWSKFKDAKYFDSTTGIMLPQGTAQSDPSSPSNPYDLMDPLQALKKAGYSPVDTSLDVTMSNTMSQEMGTQLESLNRLLAAVGYNVNDFTASNASVGQLGAALTTLKALTTQVKVQSPTDPTVYTTVTQSQFDVALQNALASTATARIYGNVETGAVSLQEILMTDYISMGNEMIFNEMSGLQAAINQNQSALSYLNSLQDLMNQKDPQQFILNLSQLSTTNPQQLVGQDATGSNYDTYESTNFQPSLNAVAYFQTNQDVDYASRVASSAVDPTTGQPYPESNDLHWLKDSNGNFVRKTSLFVNAFSQKLSTGDASSYTFSLQTIINNLGALVNNLQTATASNLNASSNLISSIQRIQSDMQTIESSAATSTTGDVTTWVQDMTSNSTYQTDLNTALTASQAFNDTERENLQNVMFVFEEFYKSSTSLLSDITQLIEKIASFISK